MTIEDGPYRTASLNNVLRNQLTQSSPTPIFGEAGEPHTCTRRGVAVMKTNAARPGSPAPEDRTGAPV